MDELDDLNDARSKPPSRRGLLRASLLAGMGLAGAGLAAPARAEIFKTDTRGIIANDVLIKAADGPLPGFFARPEGFGRFPIVLVNEHALGVDTYLKECCRQLARQGYAAVTVEIYARFVDPSKLEDPTTVMRNVIPRTPDAQVMTDLDAAIAFAAGHGGDPGRIGVTGFGRGGRTTWLYDAYNPRVRAAVAWYGPVLGLPTQLQPYRVVDVAPRIFGPLLALYGGQDPLVPVPDIQMAVTMAKAAGRAAELVIYPDAGESFHAYDNPAYRPDAAQDGWLRMIDWFRHFGV